MAVGMPSSITFDYPNWTQEYGMYCAKSVERESARSYFVLFNCIGCLVNLILIDVTGRMFASFSLCLTTLAGLFAAFYSDNFSIKLAGLGLANASTYTCSSLYAIIMTESSSISSITTQEWRVSTEARLSHVCFQLFLWDA